MFDNFFEKTFDFIGDFCIKLIGIIACIIFLPFTLLMWLVVGMRWFYDGIKYIIKNKVWR